jgi:hypothetical protein
MVSSSMASCHKVEIYSIRRMSTHARHDAIQAMARQSRVGVAGEYLESNILRHRRARFARHMST